MKPWQADLRPGDYFIGYYPRVVGLDGYYGGIRSSGRHRGPPTGAEHAFHICGWYQARSNRSRFITLFHAATKSCTNFCSESSHP